MVEGLSVLFSRFLLLYLGVFMLLEVSYMFRFFNVSFLFFVLEFIRRMWFCFKIVLLYGFEGIIGIIFCYGLW